MEQNTLRSYALALLSLWKREDGARGNRDRPPLGWAFDRELQQSRFTLAAHRFLPSLLEHSPSPEVVAHQFMTALAQCENPAVIGLVNALDSDRSVSPGDWAAAVYDELSQNGNLSESPLRDLAVSYLAELIVPFKNPAGRTSSESNTPNLTQRENSSLLESATVRHNRAALEELVLRRDGPRCIISGGDLVEETKPHCTHIIPLYIHNKTEVHAAIEKFTGNEVRAAEVQHLINRPANAINMKDNWGVSMDQKLAWGIEVRSVNNEWKYYFRIIRPAHIYADMPLSDGDEIEFGKGEDENTIELPDPRLCTLHLAVARVYATSGFAEVVDEMKKWDEAHSIAEVNYGDNIWRHLLFND